MTPDWNTNRYNPYCFSSAFDSDIRGVSYSPDNVVYVGGHQRWAHNPYGSDFAGPGAVPRPGLEALDPASGRPLQWNPGRNPPGKAVYALLATSEGLWVGSNTDYVGNFTYLPKKIVLFPYAGGTPLAATNVGALPGSVFLGGPVSGTTNTNVLYRVNAGGPAIASIDNGPDSGIVDERTNTVPSSVDLRNVRGIFAAGDNVYFALRADSTLYRAGWSGSAVTGTPVAIGGPAVDGLSWASRSMFLFAGPTLNQPPAATFSSTCTGAACALDASASTDSDGVIASYAWEFGDNTSGTGPTVSHTYAAAGDYSVTLTVTDDKGATSSVTKTVAVTSQASSIAFVSASHSAPGAAKVKAAPVPASTRTGDLMLMVFSRPTAATFGGPTGVVGWTPAGTVTNGSVVSTVWSKTAGRPTSARPCASKTPAPIGWARSRSRYTGVPMPAASGSSARWMRPRPRTRRLPSPSAWGTGSSRTGPG